MGKITDLLLFRKRGNRDAEELTDELMVRMLRAAGLELEELRLLVRRIAMLAHDVDREPPGGAKRRLQAISALLKDYGQ